MILSKQEKQELLSYNSGEPIIVTPIATSDESEEYKITMFVRTIKNPTPRYIDSVQLKLSFFQSYPRIPPCVYLYKTHLFHPNFTTEGVWLGNVIRDKETISDYLMRLIRTIQFKEIDLSHIADRNAMAWYNRKKNGGIFPTDKINYSARPRISIFRVNESMTLQL